MIGDPRQCLSYKDASVMSSSDLVNLWRLLEGWTYLFSSLWTSPNELNHKRWWGQIKTIIVFSITKQISTKEKYFKIWQDNKRIPIQGSSFLRDKVNSEVENSKKKSKSSAYLPFTAGRAACCVHVKDLELQWA